MEITVKGVVAVADGLHEGVITKVEYRTTPQGYEYTDVFMDTPDMNGKAVSIKASFPRSVSTASKLGQLLMKLGAVLEEGKMIDPDTYLIGATCKFQTTTKTTEKGKFAEVLTETITCVKKVTGKKK